MGQRKKDRSARHGAATPAVAALEADERPEAYVFLAGESAMVRALRRLSVGPGGVPKKHVSFMGYWREGQAES